MPGVRLVATDIDGTLLRSDYTISDRSRAAIAQAAEAGLLIVFVTGRPPRWLDEIGAMTGHTGVAVAANGAVTYDLHTSEIVGSHPLEPELIRSVTTALRARFPEVTFGLEYGLSFGHEPDYRHDWEISPTHDRAGNLIAPPTIGHLDEIGLHPAVKLLAKDRTAEPDEFMAAAAELLHGQATVTHSSKTALLEIAAAGITKATGLADIAAREGFDPSQVAAIGDMPNDLPMLAWAGHSFAVANAHPSVQAAADQVVDSNDDDAVAQLIEWVLHTYR
ncbi:hypothetical protein SAMN05444157_0508 [Frankineae bacterium MT45]|nr:hypothetical protein SAMN05444157_0508 [Frankineae bacterium MT45]